MIQFKSVKSLSAIEKSSICNLVDHAFLDETHSKRLAEAFFQYRSVGDILYIVGYDSNLIIGFAVIGFRRINYLGFVLKAATIGSVAIHPKFQGQGYGTQLMSYIESVAIKNDATVMYLQGIDKYYSRFGLYPVLSKSKFLFDCNKINKVNLVEVRAVAREDLDAVKGIYKQTMQNISCAAIRSDREWGWIFPNAIRSLYFYMPKIVLKNGNPVAYFATDPNDAGRVRESGFYSSADSASALLYGIAKSVDAERFEVMTQHNSLLYKYCKLNQDSEFYQYIKTDGSQMLKILNLDTIANILRHSFIKTFKKIEYYSGEFEVKFSALDFSGGVAKHMNKNNSFSPFTY